MHSLERKSKATKLTDQWLGNGGYNLDDGWGVFVPVNQHSTVNHLAPVDVDYWPVK